ncbi:MAG: hypothetical protein HY064_06840 [Bacteroidetes bacterium]|nr:hypothetical protein [Bacteroidota bacterium]
MVEEENKNAVAPQRKSWWKKILRIFLWTGGGFLFLILLLLTLLWIYRDDVKSYMIAEVNKRVNTTILVAPQDIDVTIISSFPNVAVVFSNISALDAVQSSKRDTLLTAKKISFAFNIMDLFHENYVIKKIYMGDAKLKLWVDEKGNDNYHFLKEEKDTVKNDTSHVAFALNDIHFENVHFIYHDKKAKQQLDLAVNDIRFTGNFGTEKYIFGTEADLFVNTIQSGKTSYFRKKHGTLSISMEVNNATSNFSISKAKLSIEDFNVGISGNAKQVGKNYRLDLAVKGEDIDLPSALSLLPASYAQCVCDFESSGEFYLNGKVNGLCGDTTVPDVTADFGIRSGGTISRKNSGVSLHDVSLSGNFSNAKGNEGFRLSSFSASSAKSNFSGNFSMKGFSRPEFSAKLNGAIDLEELQSLLQIDTIEKISGNTNISFSASGKPSSGVPTISDFRKFQTGGKISMHSVTVKLKGAKEAVDSINGDLSFDGNNVTISDLAARTASSDLVMSGNVKNLLGYIFTDKEVLDISGDLSSKNLDLNKLLEDGAPRNSSSDKDSSYRLLLPERIRFDLNTSIHHVIFRKFEADDVAGDLVMNKKRLTADPVSFHSMDGSFDGSGMIDGSLGDSLLITCNATIKDVSMYKLFYQMENFGQEKDTVITYNNVRGKLTSQVNFASMWGNDLEVNERKIYTDADITITQGELIKFLPFDALSKFIKLEDLRDVKFQKLHNNITIKNRIIDIPKMEINSSAINVTMSGTHDFDNNVDYHFIVDMDELHAKKVKAAKKENSEFGEEIEDGGHRTRLYISMKGYIGNPDMSYDKKGAVEGIKDDLHQQKEDLKQILHNEFGVFKDDSLNPKDKNKKEDRKKETNGKFILEQDNAAKKKKGDDKLDDSDDY